MRKKKQDCPKWQPERPYVPLPLSLLRSPAWRSLSVAAHRLLLFLMIEHMGRGGHHNGNLLAPRRQLIAFGIHAHCITAAIEELDRAGLIDCIRGTGRAPSRYALTWLPLAGATEPTNRWRQCAAQAAHDPDDE